MHAGQAAGREAAEGTVQSYIHANGKIGVLVEVDCNTDFVARNEDFSRVREGRRAARGRRARPRNVSRRRRPGGGQGGRAARATSSRRPTSPRTSGRKIAEGKLNKWLDDVVLLDQRHVNADKHEEKTIQELREELSAKTGENVVIRRFARFTVGD